MPPERPSKGRLRIGKYEVLRHIASGGMGAVYRAIDTDLGREVALKVLSPQLAASPGMLERFRREARSAARLRHENIVAIYDVGEAAGTHYLALEFIDGIDLHEFVSRRGRLAPEVACDILTQAARALDHAHRQNIVHRDVKPSNLLISEAGGKLVVKLADLGLARHTGDDEFRVTRAGTTIGTVDYMSPEQARDSTRADIRSDLYSLGCTFYHMLAGHCPFPEGSLTERLYKHVEDEPPDIRGLHPAVGPGPAAILRRLLMKKPEDRFQTPAELLQALADPEGFAAASDSAPSLTQLLVELDPSVARRPRPTRPRSAPGTVTSKPRKRFRDEDEAATPASPHSVAGDCDPGPASQRPATAKGSVAGVSGPGPASQRPATAKGSVAGVCDPGPASQRPATTARPRRWPLVAGAAAAAILAGVLLVLGGGGQPTDPPPTTADAPPKKAPPGPRDIKPHERPPPPPREVPAGPKLQPVHDGAVDVAAARAEFEGPLGRWPEVPAGTTIVRVRRGATGEDCPTLADALVRAAPDATTLIEIHDQGPLFESALPPLSGRSVVIRAAAGFRPLLVWDAPSGDAGVFLAVEKGGLTLEGLDAVVRWTDARVAPPAALFRVVGGTLHCRDCTVSVAGRHPAGVHVFRLEGRPGAPLTAARVSRCFLRGDLTALALSGDVRDVLLDGCLVAGGERPLIDAALVEDPACTLRLVRSTLAGARTCLRVAPAREKGGTPGLRCLLWDTLLARAGTPGEGELLSLAGGARTTNLGWRALNCLYAGWDKLMAAPGRDVPGGAVEAWRTLWSTAPGDRAVAAHWPRGGLPAGLEEIGPAYFDPSGTFTAFAATAGPGLLGCDLSALPGGRGDWTALAAGRSVLLPVPLPGDDGPPPIPPGGDGRYHGEFVKMTRQTDLGELLRQRLRAMAPGPKIVLRLSGEGDHSTSPVVLRGADLTIYVDRPEGKARPLTLSPHPATAGEKPALIEVEGGSLEMRGVRVAFENRALTPAPARAVKVSGGHLRLHACYLEGPMDNPSPAYQELIAFAGSDAEAPDRANRCVLNECVLLSGRAVLRARGSGIRLRWQQCVAVAADDLLHLDPAGVKGRPNLHLSLENNTLAVRGAALRLGDAPGARAGEPAIVQAEGNLFLDPFAESPRRSCVLLPEGGALARGLVVWQGRGNGYDNARLASYLGGSDAPEGRQPHAAWVRLWGKAGEQQAVLVDWPASASFPASRPQLERLRLPPGVVAPVGADLMRLGISARGK